MIYGVGINDMPRGWCSENELNKRIYNCWHHMLQRCYDNKTIDRQPTYKDCYVCDRWLLLSNFVEDIRFIDNYKYWASHPNERVALDKDIKSNGANKCYCLEQCMFVTLKENTRQAVKNRDNSYLKVKYKTIGTTELTPVLQFDKKGNFIKKWETIIDVERELGIDHSNIAKCCNGKRKTAGGFIWKYA